MGTKQHTAHALRVQITTEALALADLANLAELAAIGAADSTIDDHGATVHVGSALEHIAAAVRTASAHLLELGQARGAT